MKIVRKNKVYFLNLENDLEKNNFEDFLSKDLSIFKENNKITISIKKDYNQDVKKKIKKLLEDKNLTFQDKVEGSFEKLLNKEDLSVFKKMVQEKEIEIYKPSNKYKKGVYQIRFKKLKEDLKDSENSISFFNKKKYVIIKDSNDAKTFSQFFNNKIKNKEIIGIKSFDGKYYVISKDLFLEVKEKIFSKKINSKFDIETLSFKVGILKDILKIVIEILKEEGLIIEERKNNFKFI